MLTKSRTRDHRESSFIKYINLRAAVGTMFMAPITEWIKKRTSWRTYNGKTLSENDRKQLQEFIESDHGTPFGSRPRFTIIDCEASRNLGTYGFITGTKHFIAGTAQDTPMGVEDYGYALEKIILYATMLSLGTCWLGGTYNKQSSPTHWITRGGSPQ